MAYVFPTAAELKEVEQVKVPRLLEARPVFQIMPVVNVDAHLLEWEQEDDWTGLQQVRGLGGPFTRVQKKGLKRYLVQPGIYGEFLDLDEQEMTTLRQPGTWDRPIDVSEQVMRLQDRLLERRLDRIEQIIWALLTTGTFSVSGDGGVLHTDTYSLATFAAAVAWGTVATSTPIADFRSVQLQSRAKGVSFGRNANAWMNRKTFNQMVSNTNNADLGARFTYGGISDRSAEHITRILGAEDLPEIVIYDQGYLDDTGTFQPFIPDSKVVVTGKRTSGAVIADYAMTRNSNNPNMAPGPYTEVIETREPPKRVQVFDGHNGGPRVYFPSAIVIMTV